MFDNIILIQWHSPCQGMTDIYEHCAEAFYYSRNVPRRVQAQTLLQSKRRTSIWMSKKEADCFVRLGISSHPSFHPVLSTTSTKLKMKFEWFRMTARNKTLKMLFIKSLSSLGQISDSVGQNVTGLNLLRMTRPMLSWLGLLFYLFYLISSTASGPTMAHMDLTKCAQPRGHSLVMMWQVHMKLMMWRVLQVFHFYQMWLMPCSCSFHCKEKIN